jgi:hypothetical protein
MCSKKKRYKRIQQMEPKVKIGDYEAKLKAKRERAAQLKAQLDTMEVSFAKLPALTPRISRANSPHYLTQHGARGNRSGRRRRQQQQAASGSGAPQATHATPRAVNSGGRSSSGQKGSSDKSSGRKNVRAPHPSHRLSSAQPALPSAVPNHARTFLTLSHTPTCVCSGRDQRGNRRALAPGCPKLAGGPRSSSPSISPIGCSSRQQTRGS